ncbi:MAG TPA: AgmX/PglI C-terminal domain-containing protein [Kofleriaceae bacterium]|jgi:hypothetical protein
MWGWRLIAVVGLLGASASADTPTSRAAGAPDTSGEAGGASAARLESGFGVSDGTYRPSKETLLRLDVKGALKKDIVQRYLHRNYQKLLHCYDNQRLATPDIEGIVQTKFVIADTGTVKGADVAGIDSSLDQCVRQILTSIEFPKPKSGDVTVTVNIKYAPAPPPLRPKPPRRGTIGGIGPRH